jgi:hypothetical protein
MPASSYQPQSVDSNLIAKYRYPDNVDPDTRYVFYLHGKIIEDQGVPAISPEFGEYEYPEILTVLESKGFIVISEQRAKATHAEDYAGIITGQVNDLLDSGVEPGSITVVGASKGAAIAASVSNLVSDSGVNFVLLGACYQPMIETWMEQGRLLYGNVLSIYDFADDYAASCQELFDFSAGIGLGEHKEIVLQVGTGHGILYKPLPEWILPTIQWANQER